MDNYEEDLWQADWESIVNKLLAYTEIKIRNQITKRVKPSGKELIYQAIEKVLFKERSWNKEYYPNLIDLIRGIIDSDIDAIITSYDNKNLTSHDKSISKSDDGEEFTLKDIMVSEDKIVYSLEENELFELKLQKCFNCLEEDDELELVFLCMKEGMQDKEISQTTNLSIEDVRKIKKKIRRRITKDKIEIWGRGYDG